METLVCLALAALIGVLLVNALRVAGSVAAASTHVRRAEEIQSVRDHLRRALGSLAGRTRDGSRPVLRGGPDGLSALLAPDRALERASEVALTIARIARPDGTYDIVESRVGPDARPGAAPLSEVLLARVAGFGIRYFGAQTDGAAPGWHAAWIRPDRQPALLELQIAFHSADRRRWPALLISLDGRP